MLGPIPSSLGTISVDAFTHGVVAWARTVLGKAPQLCVTARFDSQLNASPSFLSTLSVAPSFMTSLGVAPSFLSTLQASGEFSSMIQVNLTWPECE